MPDIVLYSRITEGASRDVRDRLKAAGTGDVHVRINSPGGSVLEGVAIYELLAAHPGRVVVSIDGYSLSIASVIAMAGDEVEMAANAWLMIHDPTGLVDGGSAEMRRMGALLDKSRQQLVSIYAERTKRSAEEISRMMAEETWLTAQDAVKLGFIDRIVPARRMAAAFDVRALGFANVPPALQDQTTMDSKAITDLRAACPGAPADFLLSQIEAGASTDQARAAWLDHREKQLQEREAKLKTAPAGVAAIGDGGKARSPAAAGDSEAFVTAVDEKIKSGVPRLRAVAEVGRAHPDWHHAFVAEHNSQTPKIQNLISERFAL